MSATVEKLDKGEAHILVEIAAAEFVSALEAGYLRERSRYAVQGFRRGKAPRKVIERYYGEDTFHEAAIDTLWQQAFIDACTKNELKTVGQPHIHVDYAVEGEPLKLTFHTTLYPEVKLSAYKGVNVVKVDAVIPEEAVMEQLENARKSRVRYIEVDRPIKMGDRLVMDYKGRTDDGYFAGGTAEKQELEIGSGRFIPGFEEQMIGKKLNEWNEITVKFPDEYPAAELAGKEAIFEVFVHEAREPELPDMNDDFAKDASEYDTLDEWKAGLGAKMEEEAARDAKNQMRNAA